MSEDAWGEGAVFGLGGDADSEHGGRGGEQHGGGGGGGGEEGREGARQGGHTHHQLQGDAGQS